MTSNDLTHQRPADPTDHPRPWLVLAVCAMALFLVGLDTTIVAVALPDIGDDLDIGLGRLAWVVDAYTLTVASLMISAGAVADRFGRRRVFRWGLAIFGAASAVAALAPTAAVLIGARVVQGVGGAMLAPVALAIVVNVFTDPRRRAKAIGVWASVFGISMAAGPLLGGALIEAFGWRAVLWVVVPFVVLTWLATFAVVPESIAAQPRQLDPLGQVLAITIIAGLVGLLIEGGQRGALSSWMAVGALVVVVAGVAFWRVESLVAQPLIELELFRAGSFRGAVAGAVATFIALTVTIVVMSVHLQRHLGLTPLAAGLTLLALAAGATLCAPMSGALVGRRGARLPLVVAGSALLIGGVAGAVASSASSAWPIIPGLIAVGIGFGFANPPLTATAVAGLPLDRSGVAGGIVAASRQVGAAIGAAVAGVLLAGHVVAGPLMPSGLVVVACGVVVLVVGRGHAAAR